MFIKVVKSEIEIYSHVYHDNILVEYVVYILKQHYTYIELSFANTK